MKLAKLGDGPEIFHTIQGEGASAGCPAVFIRTSRCNLHCHWCDTDHTWNFVGTPWTHEKDADPGYRKHDKGAVTIELTPAEAAKAILDYDCPRVVITGGEPLLQQDELVEMIGLIRKSRPASVFEVETNGTRTPTTAMAAAIDQFNVSPKLSNSGIQESLRMVPDAIRSFAANPMAWFKFVVLGEPDIAEIQTLLTTFQIPAERVILMPEGRSTGALDQRAEWLATRCRDLGLRFGDRLHVRLWGDRRGV